MQCTGYADGHSGVCVGDSGSPFLEGNQIVGFFSWMSNACNTYGVYARVTTYADEIMAHLPSTTPSGDIALSASGPQPPAVYRTHTGHAATGTRPAQQRHQRLGRQPEDVLQTPVRPQ
jgi:secreted trypsin-like serine protease